MRLLLDVGNTRLKWALQSDGSMQDVQSAVHAGRPENLIAELDCDPPVEIRISSVMKPAQAQALETACFQKWKVAPQFARAQAEAQGLRNGYKQFHRLGVDRWLAMLAAWTETRGACVVVDAGTALTVDVIDDHGQHQGGIIAAGLMSSRRAVLKQTRFQVDENPLPAKSGLGIDTESCVAQGAVLSCIGAVIKASQHVTLARKFICGGDAEVLIGVLGKDWEHRPNLVLEGLLIGAQPGP